MKVWNIARKEAQDARRNRWYWFYTGAFALLSLALAGTALLGSGFGGLAGFGRTSASMINLVLLVIPLMGLTSGSLSLTGERERGTLAYLLAQPISRAEIFWGKFLGQVLSLGASLVLGFGLSGLLLGRAGGAQQWQMYAVLLALSLLLALVSLGLGFCVGSLCRRSSAALGASLVVWLGLAFFADMILMGLAGSHLLPVAGLFHCSLANPVQLFRLSALLSLRANLDMLGPVGVYATRTYQHWTLPALLSGLALWAVLPALFSYSIYRKRSYLG